MNLDEPKHSRTAHPKDSATSPSPALSNIFNTYWVLPNRLLAGRHPGESEFEAAKAKMAAFLTVGIRTFIDLTEEDESYELGKRIPTYQPALREASRDDRLEITYLRAPIPDRETPSVWTMRCILDVIDRSLADDNPVYAHCWAGRGRTGTVVGCFLQRHGMAEGGGVVAKIAELRKNLSTRHDSSPHTPQQVRMVRNWKPGA